MTVRELRESLRGIPGDSEVYVVGDWSAVDDYGDLTDLRPVVTVTTQPHHCIDREAVEVLLEAMEVAE